MTEFCHRHYRWLSVLTLALASFNVGFRLDREVVTAWDEALYATSAAEMVQSGNWVVTTFDGKPDAYNAKPPLNVWLIAASFRLIGITLLSLRLASALAALVTIALMQWWVRRAINPATALLTTIVLSTTFDFLYVHSGRSGNPDALFALTVAGTAFAVWRAQQRPVRLLWLAPVLSVAFMLKGTAVLMPVAIAAIALGVNRCNRRYWVALMTSVALAGLFVTAWVVERWHADGGPFFSTLVRYDFVEAARQPLEGHDGSVLFYLHQVQKDQYDWLLTAIAAVALLAAAGPQHRRIPIDAWTGRGLMTWAAVTVAVPTIMATKLPWYVNPFFPVFSVTVAVLATSAFDQLARRHARVPLAVLAVMMCASFGVAESKLWWYSFTKRDLSTSIQGTLLDERHALTGRILARSDSWDLGDRFVVKHMIGAIPIVSRVTGEDATRGWSLVASEVPAVTSVKR